MFDSIVCFWSVPRLEKSPVPGPPRLVVSTIVLSALLSGVAVHQVHAQNNAPIFNWQGEVQVSPSTLKIREGETLAYEVRLSEQPAADGWWLRIHVDGVVYYAGRLEEKGISWVPSVGWQFNREEGKEDSDPTQWRSVRIEALQDDDDDEDEFVTITHEVWDENSNCPPSLHGVAPVEVQVTDDETSSTGVTLSVNRTTVSEGAGRTTVVVRAALNGAARLGSTAVTVAVGKTGDSATEGTDYETVDDLTVTIPAGMTSATETFTLTPTDDNVDEGDETVTVSGTTSSGLTLTPTSLTVTITDNETSSTGVTLSVNRTTVSEGAGGTTVTVRAALNGAARLGSTAVTVAVGKTGDSATEGMDYETIDDLTVTIPAESTSGTAAFTLIPVDDDIDESNETITVSGTTSSGLTLTPTSLTVTIIDDDERGVTVTPTALTLTEGGDPNDVNTYTVVLRSQPTGPVTVTLAVTGDSDVTASTETLSFTDLNWDMPQTVTMSAAEDTDTVEDTATVAHTPSGADYTGVTAESVSVMVPDDDTASTAVTLNLSPGMVSEGVGGSGRTVTVTGRLNGAPRMSPTVVTLSVAGGTATVAADFTAVDSFTLTIATGATSETATFTLIPVDDDIDESDETVTVSGTTSSGLTLTPTSLTVTIIDDETTSTGVALSVNPTTVSEGAGGTTVTVRAALNGAARLGSTAVMVAVGKTGDSATEGTDYEIVDDLTVTIPTGLTSATKTFTLTPTDDAIREGDETISVTGTTSVSGLTVTDAELRIRDNETAPPPIPRSPTVSWDAGSYHVLEGETVEVTVRLSSASTRRLTIPLTAKNEDGASDEDYSGVPETVVFDPGDFLATFTFSAVDDGLDEGEETVRLGFGPLSAGVAVGSRATAELTIEDKVLGVGVAPKALEVPEGDSETYTVVLSGQPTGTVTVTVTVPGGTDFMVDPLGLNFTTGDWSVPQTVTVTAAEDDDAVVDAVTLTHTADGGGYDGETAVVQVTTLENDVTELAILDGEVIEDQGEIVFAVTMNIESSQTVGVEWATADGTAKAGEDYVHGTGELVFGPGETRREVQVSVLDDMEDELEEAFTVSLANPSGATLERAHATGVIIDDDLSAVSIGPGPSPVEEGNDVRFDLVRRGDLTDPLSVTLSVTESGAFLSGTPPATVVFQPGEATAVLQMGTEDDDRDEEDGTVEAVLAESEEYAIEGSGRAVVAVTDNDDAPTIKIEGARALESLGEIFFPVKLDAASDRTVTVEWATSDGTATRDQDYRAESGVVVFSPCQTEKRIRIVVLDDMEDELEEAFTVSLANPSGATLERAHATGVIIDDDLSAVSIGPGPSPVEEGNDVRFDLVRRGDLTDPLSVTLSVTESGAFLSGTPPATVVFQPGEATAVLQMGTEDDDRDEEDGTVEAVLAESEEYAIEGSGSAVVAVTDNDDAPTIKIEGARALEYLGEIFFPVKLGAASDRTVTVEWATSDGTATRDQDYRAESGVVVFSPGQTEERIRVVVLDDMLVEGEETFKVTLAGAVNGTLDEDQATGLITDEDGTVVKAWLTRFGRTVATQVVEAVSQRFTGPSRRASQVTIGGQSLTSAFEGGADAYRRGSPMSFGSRPLMSAQGLDDADLLSRAGESFGVRGGGWQGTDFSARRLVGHNVLATSSFHLSFGDASGSGKSRGGRWAAWGRGVTTQFSGRETDLSLDGGVLTGLLGADYERGPMLVGVAVSRSQGAGDVALGVEPGILPHEVTLEGSLTSVYPYLRAAMGKRLLTWGLFGYGRGELEASGKAGIGKHAIGMKMGAFGARGSLLTPEQLSGFELAVKTDALLVGMESESEAGAAIKDANASRMRLLLEGARDNIPAWGGLLGSSLELGVRRDGGAAETGIGLEMGGGLSYVNPDRGLTLSMTARRLMAHEDQDYREWGIGGMVEYDPGIAGRGLSMRMLSSWGTTASGTNRLWSQSAAAGFGRNGDAGADAPLTAEVNYGLRAFDGRLEMAPYADLSLVGADSRAHSVLLGWRLQFGPNIRLQFEVDLGDRSYGRFLERGLMGRPGPRLGNPGLQQ